MAKEKDNTTKSFVLRIDAETMSALEAWAADEFRSINGQLQWIINEALRKNGRLKEKDSTKPAGTTAGFVVHCPQIPASSLFHLAISSS